MKGTSDYSNVVMNVTAQDYVSMGRSIFCKAQRQRIFEALRQGPKTSYDLRSLGCYQVPTCISEVRCIGVYTKTELVDLYDRDSYFHRRCATYRLLSEPAREGGDA